MARGLSSIVTTAVVAGAIGFGAGVYLVPNEKADQFRAMVQGGLGAIYRIVHSDKANPDIPPSESSQTKAPEAQPDVPAGSQPSADANAILATRRVVVDSLSMPHRRDVAAPSSSSPGQDDQPSHALDTGPSGTVPPNSSPTIESDAPKPVAPETAKNPLPRK